MKKAIYKIQNKNNGKIYIGQSVDPLTRWSRHKKNRNSYIGRAIGKEGEESFTFEVLEWTEDFDKRERYYIEKLKTLAPVGYNLTSGGMGHTKLTNSQIEEVIKLLKTEATIFKISEITGICFNVISKINSGKAYRTLENYPVRPTRRKPVSRSEILEIEELLIEQKEDCEIRESYNLSRTLLSQIKAGQHRLSSPGLSYPIGKNPIVDRKIFVKIEEMLGSSCFSYELIAKKTGVERELVNKINWGEHSLSRTDKKYPIRKTRTFAREDEVREIERLLASGMLKKDIAIKMGRSDGFVRNINQGKHKFSSKNINFPIR